MNAIPEIIVIVGATASGKSDVAMTLARKFSGEIVNADSMQVYRKMDIGTAKPSVSAREEIPHHLFDIVDPDEEFTAADYSSAGRSVVEEIASRGRLPIVVGGTGLYIKALLSGLIDAPGADDSARAELNEAADRHGNEYLLELLMKVDPDAAMRIHPNNRVRIIRALEVFRQSGKTLSEFQSEHGFALKWCNSLKIGINVERNELYERIGQRVDRMMAEGLVSEVKTLLSQGYSPGLKSLSAIGYKEVTDYLGGKYCLSEAVELIKRNTRRYAKRQVTWFKNDAEIQWFNNDQSSCGILRSVEAFLLK